MASEARRPELIIVAGPNGSGKTTVAEPLRLKLGSQFVYVNQDSIARQEFGDLPWAEASRAAAVEAKKRRKSAIECNLDLLCEMVLAHDDQRKFIKKAKAQGYFVRIVFIGTETPEINIRRVAGRVRDGGHDIPVDTIVERHGRSIVNAARMIRVVDRVDVLDNSRDDEIATEVFHSENGRLAAMDLDPSVIPGWCRVLMETLWGPGPKIQKNIGHKL